MACNAWNHPAHCDCGWGGMNHGGSRSRPTTSPFVVSGVWTGTSNQSKSVTRPTACPFCGDPVYFFRDQNGGSTFFDDLGPPWPKHPCFDTDSYPDRKNQVVEPPLKAWPNTEYGLKWARELKKERDLFCKILARYRVKESETLLFECIDSGTRFHMCGIGWPDELPSTGFIRSDFKVGQFSYRPALRDAEEIATCFGPCFECFDASAWIRFTTEGHGSPLIAKEISEGRENSFGGFFFSPAWREALDIYVNSCLTEHQPDLLRRAAILFSGPSTTILAPTVKFSIRRLLRDTEGTKSVDDLAVYDEILDLLVS